jgi:hypothetical protein
MDRFGTELSGNCWKSNEKTGSSLHLMDLFIETPV